MPGFARQPLTLTALGNMTFKFFRHIGKFFLYSLGAEQLFNDPVNFFKQMAANMAASRY